MSCLVGGNIKARAASEREHRAGQCAQVSMPTRAVRLSMSRAAPVVPSANKRGAALAEAHKVDAVLTDVDAYVDMSAARVVT